MKKYLLCAAIVLSPGCCLFGQRDADTSVSIASYKSAIAQIQSNLGEIRTDVDAISYNPKLKKADLGLIDATMALCSDTLAGKNVAPVASK